MLNSPVVAKDGLKRRMFLYFSAFFDRAYPEPGGKRMAAIRSWTGERYV
jgi:hypothetical protein